MSNKRGKRSVKPGWLCLHRAYINSDQNRYKKVFRTFLKMEHSTFKPMVSSLTTLLHILNWDTRACQKQLKCSPVKILLPFSRSASKIMYTHTFFVKPSFVVSFAKGSTRNIQFFFIN